MTDVDLDSGSVSIPIRVRRKEITASLLDSLIINTTFTRGIGFNVLMAFRISNEGYKDPLYVKGLDIAYKAHTDTSSLSKSTLINMLDSVQVINYARYKSMVSKYSGAEDSLIFASYKLDDSNTQNPLKINFKADLILEPDGYEDFIVMVKFKPNSITRSFRTILSDVNAYDEGSVSPVTIVGTDGRILAGNPNFESEVYSVISNNPKETFGNYPNPFGQPPRDVTKIVFFLINNSDVTLRIFTLTGELVKSHWNKNLISLPRGLYDGYIEWDGRNDHGSRVLNGVYLCIIEIKTFGFVQKYVTKIAYIK